MDRLEEIQQHGANIVDVCWMTDEIERLRKAVTAERSVVHRLRQAAQADQSIIQRLRREYGELNKVAHLLRHQKDEACNIAAGALAEREEFRAKLAQAYQYAGTRAGRVPR